MPKVKCSVCGDRVDRDGLYRSQGMVKVCSEECYKGIYKKKAAAQAKYKPKKTGDPTPKTRKEVLKRDRVRCRFCGTQSTHLHHIHYRSEHWPDMHSPINLITLCPKHHDVVHSNKRYWQPVLLAALWLYYTGETATVDVHLAERKVLKLRGGTQG